MTADQLSQMLSHSGIAANALARIRADQTWQQLVRGNQSSLQVRKRTS